MSKNNHESENLQERIIEAEKFLFERVKDQHVRSMAHFPSPLSHQTAKMSVNLSENADKSDLAHLMINGTLTINF